MKSHFSLTVLTFYFFSYLLICLHWQSYPTIFKGKDFYKNSQILQIQMAIHFLIFRVGNLVHIIKWPIKASFSVHILTIFAFHHHMNFSNIISVNLGLNKIDHYFRNGRFVGTFSDLINGSFFQIAQKCNKKSPQKIVYSV